MEKLAKWIIKFRFLIIAIVLIVTVFLGLEIRKIHINSDFVKSLPADDPVATLYKEIGEKYKGTDMGMIIIQANTIYTAQVISDIKLITDSLKSIDGLVSVTSLTDVMDIKSDSFGIEISKLVDEYNLPTTLAQLEELRQRIDSKDMYKGSIISADGTASIITFTFQTDVNQQEVSEQIKSKINALNLPEKLNYGGMPMMMDDISNLIISDMMFLIPVIAIILLIILGFSFRSLRGIIYPLITVAIASVWAIGLMSFLNFEITLVTGIIPVVLFAVGSAYVIHVVNHVNEIKEDDPKKVVIISLSYIIVPVFLSAITTVFGFSSFIFGAYLTMIKDFGLFSGVGTVVALLLSLTFIPALQYIFPPKYKSKKAENNKNSFLVKNILTPVSNLVFKHPKYILVFWAIVIVFGIIASFNIERSTNIANYFKDNNPTRISEKLLQDKFGGSSPIFVVFKGDMQSLEVLSKMSEMEKFMKQDPYVTNANSVADLVEQMNDAMGEGVKIPDEQAKIEQLWFLLDGQDVMSQLVNDDLTEGIIQSRYASDKTKDINPFLDKVQQWISENSTDDCQITLNGLPSVYVRIDQSLLKSQLSSLALAIILVFILISIVIRSAKLGLIGIIPILSTITLLFGFMGITHIPLDIATVLVASVAMGIGIDYSVHIINSFNYNLKVYNDVNQAIRNSILVSGKAIIINVITVAGGFLVLLFSNMVPIQSFGLLIAISMLFSGFGSLTLLPVIIIITDRKRSFTKS